MVKAVSLFQAMVDGNGMCQGAEERKDMGRKGGMGKKSWVGVLGRGAAATETIKQNSKEKYAQLVPEHLRTRPQLEKISLIVLFLSKIPSPPSIAVVVATLGCHTTTPRMGHAAEMKGTCVNAS